jgi:heme A synthase
MAFVKFMTSGAGRIARVVLGGVVISVGLLVAQGTLGMVMAVVGLIPIAGGAFDFCVAGAALGYPFWGAEARKKIAGQ